MDAAEALAQLKGARDLGLRLGQAAKSAGGHPLASFDDGQSVPKWLDQVDPKKDGKHAGAVNGQEALKGNDRALGDPVEAFASPVVLMESPSAALLVTEAGIAAFAGQDLSISAQSDVHQTAAHTWASVTGKTTSCYVHTGGVRAFAANGPVSLRAHTDALQIWADKDVTIISVNDQITISASSKIELIAGQSSVTLDGADIEFRTPGAFTVKGSGHAFLGGGSASAEISSLPVGLAGEAANFIELNYHYDDLEPMKGAPFKLRFADGSVRSGKLDDQGFARIEGVPPGVGKLELGEDARKWASQAKQTNEAVGSASSAADAIALIERMTTS